MARFHVRHDLQIEQFVDVLVQAAVDAGAEPAKARTAMREAVSRTVLQADICGIFSNCGSVGYFDPFVKPQP